jgi:ABC-type uncharacterized transport system permease subunit
MIATLAAVVAAAVYAYAGWRAWRHTDGSPWTPLALAAHLLALWKTIVVGHSLQISATTAFSLLTWQSASLLWMFCLRERLHILGMAVYPLAGLLVLSNALINSLLPASGNPVPLEDWTIGVHIAFSVLSAGLLTLASITAVAIAILDQVLRNPSNLALLQRMPPLQTMERLLFQLIGIGFILLSLTILSGLLFVHDLFGQHLAQKTLLTIMAWAMFGVLLWGRFRHGWRGRVAIRWALSAYATLVVAYFGSKLIVEQILGTHWS